MNLTKAIIIWDFYDAPIEYRELSNHGGDENYVAFIPNGYTTNMVMEYDDDGNIVEGSGHPSVDFLDYNNYFGSFSISHHKVEGGWIFIGAH